MPTIERISLSSVSSIEDEPRLNDLHVRLEKVSAMHARLCIVGGFLGILTLILAVALVVCVVKINATQAQSSEMQNFISQIKMTQQDTNKVLEEIKNENRFQRNYLRDLKRKHVLFSIQLDELRNETKLKTIDVLEKSLAAIDKSIAEDREREQEIKNKWDIIKKECDSKSGLFDTLDERINKLHNGSKRLEKVQSLVLSNQAEITANLTQLTNLTQKAQSLYSEIKTKSTNLDTKFESLKTKQNYLENTYGNLSNAKEMDDILQLKEHIVKLHGLYSELNQTTPDYSEDIFHNEQDIEGITSILTGQHHEILANKQGIAVFRSRLEVVERELRKKMDDSHLRLKNLIGVYRRNTNTTLNSFQNTLENFSHILADANKYYTTISFNVSQLLDEMEKSLVDYVEIQKNAANIQDLSARIDVIDQKLNLTTEVSLWGFVEPAECQDYTNISDSWRMIKYGKHNTKHCDKNTNFNETWTRFVHPAGTMLPTHVPLSGGSNSMSKDVCGTAGSSWMRGSHPSGGEGVVNRTVCFEWSEECEWSLEIQVVKCHRFYLYKLKSPTVCDLAYCTV